jgi:hypothetical protein
LESFIYGLGFCNPYGGRSFDFPIHQDIIISKIPLEIVAENSTGSQITIAPG